MNSLGGNMSTVKLQNRILILNILKKMGAISRLDIAKILSLTPAAITIIVNEMLKEGIVKETGQLEEDERRSGRKKVLIGINYDYKYVIGINIESDSINIGVSNLKGEIIARKKMDADKTISPEALLKGIASECMKILWTENIMKESILGAGVGIVGPVDRNKGVSLRAYGLWKEKVNLKKILEDEMNVKVVIDNNVRTLALGEMEYHLNESISSMLFVKYGAGIGSTLIIGNEIYEGSRDEAGEIGHTIVDIEGDLCRCGKTGCLETVASRNAIVNKVLNIFSETKTPALFKLTGGNKNNIDLGIISKAAKEGDKEVKKIVENAVFYLALSLGNTINIVDPYSIVLYGEIFSDEFIMETLLENLKKLTCIDNPEDKVYISALNKKSNYIGGIALALREFFYNIGGM